MKFKREKMSWCGKALRILPLAVAVAFCPSPVNGSGLQGLCGYTAGEMRKDGKVGDLELVETKPKQPFRSFKRVGLQYTKSGRLSEIYAVANLGNVKPASAKREFEECVNYLRKEGVFKDRLKESPGWKGDNGGFWFGCSAAKTKDAHVSAEVQVSVNYVDPENYEGDRDIRLKTGWIVDVRVAWNDVDCLDLTPGATARRTNPKIAVRKFVEQTFRNCFKSAFPADAYESMMKRKAKAIQRAGSEDEDAYFARYLEGTQNIVFRGTDVPLSDPYMDLISPYASVSLPGARLAYGKHLTKPVCHAERVMFAYSNPKDQPGAKAPVNGAEDLALGAIVLWGGKDVKDGAKAAVKFFNGVKTWLGIEFAETNATEKATAMTFREGPLAVTAIVEPHVSTRVDYIDGSGRKLEGERLRDFELDYNHDYSGKVEAKMAQLPQTLSNDERIAKHDELEGQLLKSYGVKKRSFEQQRIVYYVVVSDGMSPSLRSTR